MTLYLTDLERARNREAAARGRATRTRERAGRIEDYLFIGGPRLTARQAAERLGVSIRTIERYKAWLREAA